MIMIFQIFGLKIGNLGLKPFDQETHLGFANEALKSKMDKGNFSPMVMMPN